MNHFHICRTTLGIFRIEEMDDCISLLQKQDDSCSEEGRKTPLIAQAVQELEEYFSGQRKTFSVPLLYQGTGFQRRTWAMLRHIAYGETITYGELAERLGCPGGARAAGAACHSNPIQIFIPCHRVVSAGPRPGGYAGGIPLKLKLLKLERPHR